MGLLAVASEDWLNNRPIKPEPSSGYVVMYKGSKKIVYVKESEMDYQNALGFCEFIFLGSAIALGFYVRRKSAVVTSTGLSAD